MAENDLRNKEMIRKAFREHLGVLDEEEIDARELVVLRGLIN
ncbi:MAG: hypothetical protein ACOWWR_13520 [Eubacteriales bacterium]